MQPKLSILIPTLHKRANMLASYMRIINQQISNGHFWDDVEVLTEIDNGEKSTGEKRNILLERSKGEYVVFHDDDDEVPMIYLALVINSLSLNPDALGHLGFQTTDGANKIPFRISKNHGWTSGLINGLFTYLRFNNHIVPIKREIAIQFKFPHIYFGEDYAWSKSIYDSGLIKTEVFIEEELYHYKYVTHK